MATASSTRRRASAAETAAATAGPAAAEWPGSAFGFVNVPLQLGGQLWRNQAAMFEAMAADARSDAAAAGASTPQQLGLLGLELCAAQLAHVAQWLDQSATAVLEGQAALVRSAEGWLLQAVRPWYGGPVSALKVQATPDPLDAKTPADLYGATMKSWQAFGAAWLNALQHDLEPEGAGHAA